MANTYKQSYKEGQFVRFDAGDTKGVGRVRGLSSSGLIDIWIIEVRESNIDPTTYPYSYITMPSSCMSEYQITEPVVAVDDKTNERLKASELYFCVLPSELYGEPAGWQIITVCPIDFWHTYGCMPDYSFSQQVSYLVPEGYYEEPSEYCEWSVEKTHEQISAELTSMGMTESFSMQKLLEAYNS